MIRFPRKYQQTSIGVIPLVTHFVVRLLDLAVGQNRFGIPFWVCEFTTRFRTYFSGWIGSRSLGVLIRAWEGREEGGSPNKLLLSP